MFWSNHQGCDTGHWNGKLREEERSVTTEGKTKDRYGVTPGNWLIPIRVEKRHNILFIPSLMGYKLPFYFLQSSALASNRPSSLSVDKQVCKYRWLVMFNCPTNYGSVGASKFSPRSRSCFELSERFDQCFWCYSIVIVVCKKAFKMNWLICI